MTIMKEEEIPDQNIFMMCESLNRTALTELPVGYSLRNCKYDELSIWKKMPFDRPDLAKEYDGFYDRLLYSNLWWKRRTLFC
jgi:hypothetical protein